MNSNQQRAATGWSRYIVYPLSVAGILVGAIAVMGGMYSGIPLMASVSCFFGAWLTHTKLSNSSPEKADAIKMFFMFLGLLFAVIAKLIND